jgi:hypothetical protein
VPKPLRHAGCREQARRRNTRSATCMTPSRFCSAEGLQPRAEAGPQRLQREVSPPNVAVILGACIRPGRYQTATPTAYDHCRICARGPVRRTTFDIAPWGRHLIQVLADVKSLVHCTLDYKIVFTLRSKRLSATDRGACVGSGVHSASVSRDCQNRLPTLEAARPSRSRQLEHRMIDHESGPDRDPA